MIRIVYKKTIKTLARSPLFWVAQLFVIINIIVVERIPLYSMDLNRDVIMDTDPRFILSYEKFVQMIPNYLSHSVMFYGAPIFAVITAMIVMNNDYGRGFFEIEKAGGIKSSTHLLGRLIALIEVNSLFVLVVSFLAVNYYYLSRHGVDGYSFWDCFNFSSVRILRTFIFCELPAILLFLSITLFFGAILKNGYAASVIGVGYVIFNYVLSAFLGFRMSTFFNKYLTTNKFSAYLYFTYYDTDIVKKEKIGMGIGHIPSPPSEVFMWVAIMIGLSLIFILFTWVITKRRKT